MSDYHQFHDEAFGVSAFLTHEECVDLIERSESMGYEEAPIDTGIGFVVATEIRNNRRVMIDDSDLAQDLWSRIQPYVPARIGDWVAHSLNERFRFYRYESNQMFRWHRDGSFRRNAAERSKLTFMIYLNEDFEGGHTEFREFKVYPREGLALCFHHPMLHEGAAVLIGKKYVLRTDVMYRNADCQSERMYEKAIDYRKE